MRCLMALILTVMILSAAGPVYSGSRDRWGAEVNIDVVSDRARSFLSIPYQDFWNGETHIFKKYLEAKKEENYRIFIRNQTPERIGVVIAVDGRNIISGKKSTLHFSESMYILNGYEHGQYDGWRTASDTIHQFFFTDLDDSYAMRTFGDSSAMGVIAVAIYREKERPTILRRHPMLDGAPGEPSAESAARSKSEGFRDESAGTGFGDERYSPAIKVVFEPERTPIQKTLIKYEWREALCQRGILDCRHEPRNRFWDEDEYAPFPPGVPRH